MRSCSCGHLPHSGVIGEAHLFEFVFAVEFVVFVVSRFAQVFHVRSDEHFAQFHEVTVVLVLN